uniref:Major sperm protein n=1 Tax=Rhabditophanes sp. KR3021 TaxID=114890 RepID=A0AC35TWW8_9BILA
MSEQSPDTKELSDFEEITKPHPVRIIETGGNNDYSLNLEALSTILLDPDHADKKVAVVSVAGAYRKGKSFLLNFFLRFLKAAQNGVEVCDGHWMKTDHSLQGFSWKGGSVRDTTGILVWSEPFMLKDKNGEEIVVILMDTQGSFDTHSTVKDNATIFALSTMIATTQIFNISQNIQEDDLQHLQLFTEYGRLALEDSEATPFQDLLFLVRDWSYPYEHEYGFEGGAGLLKDRLTITESQHNELKQLRKHINGCFEKLECFLMPHPGLKVSNDPNFKGSIKDIESDFQTNIGTFVEHIFSPENIVPKKINGIALTCRDLFEYFKAYITVFKGSDLPEPKTMLNATAEANNFAAVSQAKAIYTKGMEEICGGGTPYMKTSDLEKEHEKAMAKSIRNFKSTKKMGGTDFSLTFLEKLEEEILVQFESFLKVNASKNLFKSMKTPAVLVFLLIINYIFQELFQLIGMELFASIFSTVLFVLIGAISTWVYSRYSGNIRDISQYIDDLVQFLWENVLSPISKHGIHGATEFGIKMNTNSTINANLISIQMSLNVDPAIGIYPASGGGSAHKIINKTDIRHAFKVKTSNNERYRVKPVFGFVEPKQRTDFEILRLSGSPKEDKVVIQWAEVPAEESDPRAPFAAEAQSGEVMIPVKAE